ncbi:MAG TPA: FkbM family methyltransferase [Candidatus Binataceae bacterium]
MNAFERASIALRHLPGLERAEWLWKRVRPAYDRLLASLASTRGLERVINGTDAFKLSPQSRWFIADDYEPAVWSRVMREVRAGDRVVVVGASIGLYALAFAGRVGAAGHVTAFEPDPQSVSALKANVAVNEWEDRITVISAAVGAESGQVPFVAAQGFESRVETRADSRDAVISVPMVALDSIIRDERVDVLMIDVEGFEERVLQGARTILTSAHRRPRAIVIEVHPLAWAAVGTTSASLLGLLGESGFRVENMSGEPVAAIGDYGHVIACANDPRSVSDTQ